MRLEWRCREDLHLLAVGGALPEAHLRPAAWGSRDLRTYSRRQRRRFRTQSCMGSPVVHRIRPGLIVCTQSAPVSAELSAPGLATHALAAVYLRVNPRVATANDCCCI
jgi:hypothetical protein